MDVVTATATFLLWLGSEQQTLFWSGSLTHRFWQSTNTSFDFWEFWLFTTEIRDVECGVDTSVQLESAVSKTIVRHCVLVFVDAEHFEDVFFGNFWEFNLGRSNNAETIGPGQLSDWLWSAQVNPLI
ncbi:hypothetical protein D3C73_1183250 [compost metagenome]